MAVEGSVSVVEVKGDNLPVDDVMGRITTRDVDPRVHTGGLSQSLLEPLLEGGRHVINKSLLDERLRCEERMQRKLQRRGTVKGIQRV